MSQAVAGEPPAPQALRLGRRVGEDHDPGRAAEPFQRLERAGRGLHLGAMGAEVFGQQGAALFRVDRLGGSGRKEALEQGEALDSHF